MKTTTPYTVLIVAMLLMDCFGFAQQTHSAAKGLRLVAATSATLQLMDTDGKERLNYDTTATDIADSDADGVNDTIDTNITIPGSLRTITGKYYLDLDGRNDYAEGPQLLAELGTATIMGWIKLSAPYTENGWVMGQDVLNLKVNLNGSDKKLIATANMQTVTFSGTLETDRWYHIAAVYDGNAAVKLKLYINGQYDTNATITGASVGALGTSDDKFTMGRNATGPTDFFKGGLDEIRVFNTALSEDIVQKMVYQEIKQNGEAICGEVIPKNIELTSWASILAYYKMDEIENNLPDHNIHAANTATNTMVARLHNADNFKIQSAPMPFVTQTSGSLETAFTQENSINAADVSNYPWSIIQVNHDLNLKANLTTLGLIIAPAATVNLLNDIKLENTWYLKLDGKLDLKGKAQLLQTIHSELDPASTGFIERDQQGQSNKYNYNYWCSPVGLPNATTNNNSYTVGGVMRDGTNPSDILNINWSSGLDGAPTTPITLSNYWIFKFQNTTPIYANWSSVGSNGILLAGQGYTLKGSGAATPMQNYTFVGKPNNGTITIPISAGNLNLTGNPYPSALDADAFIKANSAMINGTLYFWEHFKTNTSHTLADYQGGYAVRNLIGGVAPVASLSEMGAGAKTPGRFIPVGQGFFITANIAGNITFNNSQRKFIKETGTASNLLFRQHDIDPSDARPDNQEDVYTENPYAKIRIGFDAANFHRQVLIGFMNELATSAFEGGYDSHNIDTQTNDMYLMNGTHKLIIEGEGYFDENKILPIGVKAYTNNPVTFTLDGTEHFDDNQPIYIHDNVTNQYHDIRNEPFDISLPPGTVLNRFSLRFKNPDLLGNIDFADEDHAISIAFTSEDQMINITNNQSDTTVKTVKLFNMLGQNIADWPVTAYYQKDIQIPVQNQSAGTYIVKVFTSDGEYSKKIMLE